MESTAGLPGVNSQVNQHHSLPVDTRRWINVGLTFVQRRRRWTNGKSKLIQRLLSAVLCQSQTNDGPYSKMLARRWPDIGLIIFCPAVSPDSSDYLCVICLPQQTAGVVPQHWASTEPTAETLGQARSNSRSLFDFSSRFSSISVIAA